MHRPSWLSFFILSLHFTTMVSPIAGATPNNGSLQMRVPPNERAPCDCFSRVSNKRPYCIELNQSRLTVPSHVFLLVFQSVCMHSGMYGWVGRTLTMCISVTIETLCVKMQVQCCMWGWHMRCPGVVRSCPLPLPFRCGAVAPFCLLKMALALCLVPMGPPYRNRLLLLRSPFMGRLGAAPELHQGVRYVKKKRRRGLQKEQWPLSHSCLQAQCRRMTNKTLLENTLPHPTVGTVGCAFQCYLPSSLAVARSVTKCICALQGAGCLFCPCLEVLIPPISPCGPNYWNQAEWLSQVRRTSKGVSDVMALISVCRLVTWDRERPSHPAFSSQSWFSLWPWRMLNLFFICYKWHAWLKAIWQIICVGLCISGSESQVWCCPGQQKQRHVCMSRMLFAFHSHFEKRSIKQRDTGPDCWQISVNQSNYLWCEHHFWGLPVPSISTRDLFNTCQTPPPGWLTGFSKVTDFLLETPLPGRVSFDWCRRCWDLGEGHFSWKRPFSCAFHVKSGQNKKYGLENMPMSKKAIFLILLCTCIHPGAEGTGAFFFLACKKKVTELWTPCQPPQYEWLTGFCGEHPPPGS